MHPRNDRREYHCHHIQPQIKLGRGTRAACGDNTLRVLSVIQAVLEYLRESFPPRRTSTFLQI